MNARGSVVGFLLLLGFAVIVLALIWSVVDGAFGLTSSLGSRTLVLGCFGVIILGAALVASYLEGIKEDGP